MNIDMIVYEGLTKILTSSGQMKTVVDIFNTNLTSRVATLKDAFEQDQRATIKDVAHALKGSCAMFGATRCADLCQEIENAALTVDMPLPKDLLEALLGELTDFSKFVNETMAAQQSETLQ